jgi:tetratricopeptide (TPR) repeat protein/energy-coupling factor transporter ATP-binding protein EcfA2
MREINVFVSSPADVDHERQRAERVVERLNGQYAGLVRLIPIRWEQKFYEARTGFQSQIPEASNCDLVIGILWSRLGSELPPEMPPMPDGQPYPSGTAYEVLTAIERSKEKGRPSVYLFRKTANASIPIGEPERQRLFTDQLDRLRAFWERYIKTREGHFKAGFQEFTNADEFETQLDALLRGWLEERVLKGGAVLWPIGTKGSPFRGLAAFGAKHAPVFFGRGGDITRAVDDLKIAAERGTPFLLLIGSSGSGKSSLARAGLSPRLTTPGVVGAVDLWRVAMMRPGEIKGEPVRSLAQCLFAGLKDIPAEEEGRSFALPELAKSPHNTAERLATALAAGDAASVAWALDQIAEEVKEKGGYDRPVRADLLLIVDQLDELFGADVDEVAREAFAKALLALVATGHVWVAATLRTDLYERLQQTPTLLDLKQKGAAYDLAPPGAAELAEIVRKPAEAAGLSFGCDEGTGRSLDEQLLADADRPDMLPLVQFALQELFDRREVKEGVLTFGAYREIGGLDGAIDKRAEAAVTPLGKAEQAALPRLLRQLAVPAREKDGVATLAIRPAPIDEAAPDEAAKRLVKALVDARILLSSGKKGGVSLRLAHERVLKSWKRAAGIVRDNAEFYRMRGHVEDQLEHWQTQQNSQDLLIPAGLPLEESRKLVAGYSDELERKIRDYIDQSIAADDKRASARRLRHRLTAAAALAFACVAVFAIWQWYVAEEQKKIALQNFSAAKTAINGLNGLIYNVAQGLQNVVGMRVDAVKSTLGEVSKTIDALDKSAPDDAELKLSRARMLANFVDAYLAAGALKDAEGAANDGLAAARTVATKEPDNQDAQRALAVSLYKLGDVQLKAGDAAGALQTYQQSLDTARKLAGSGARRVLWVSTEKLGDAKLAQKDLPGALAAFGEGLSLAKARAAEEAANPEAARDLSISLAKVASLQRAQQQYNEALKTYNESLSIRRDLARLHEGNKVARRDLALALNDLGDTSLASGDVDGALVAYNEAANVFREIAKEDPSDARAQRDVAVAFNNIGDLDTQRDDVAGARAAFSKSVAALKPLVAIDEANIPAKIELAGVLIKLAGVSDDAEALYEEVLDILEPLEVTGKLSPEQAGWIEMVKAQLTAAQPN